MAMKPRSMKKKDDKKAKMMRGGTAKKKASMSRGGTTKKKATMMRGGTATKSNVGDMEKKLKRTEEAKAGASFKA